MARMCRDSSRSYLGRPARHCGPAATGVGLRPIWKGMDQPPNPTAAWAARHGATYAVTVQEAAEAVLTQEQAKLLRHPEAERRGNG